MKFGEFLVQRHTVATTHLVAALERQRQAQQPLGRIALRHELLSINEVFNILKLQADRIDAQTNDQDDYLFGDLAIELGFLNEEELFKILRIQLETRPALGDTLVEMGVLTTDQLREEITAFRSLAPAELA